MPFGRQTLSDLRAQTAADVAAALPGADPLLKTSNLGIMSALFAEALNAAYGYLDYIAGQAVPFTAVDEAFQGWAALKNAVQKPATAATGEATFPAVAGVTVEAGTPVSRSDGAAYVTTAEVTAGGGGSVTLPIAATVAGAASTLTDGAAMVLGQAVGGVGSTGTAVALTPGVDVEDFEAFRTRVLAVYANPPQGGAIADYEEWALQVPGVTRAWCRPNGLGPGTVILYFMMDLAEAAHDGFPQGDNGVAAAETRDTPATGDQLTVADYILPLQPVTALVYAYAPLPNTVAFTISLAGVSAGLKAAMAAAIDQTFLDYGRPGGTVNNSDIEAAIRALAGTAGFVITIESCDHGEVSPVNGNITSAAGYLPVRGAITWI